MASAGSAQHTDTRFPLLDSIRALAALIVLFGHALVGHEAARAGAVLSRDVAVLPQGSWIEPYLAHRNVGVTIFFVLSGFLLYRPFVAAHARAEGVPDLRSYAWRRLLRIVPAYWFALVVTALILGMSYVWTVRNVPRFFGFLQIYDPVAFSAGIPVAWSLCIEVTFYAFLPLFALTVARIARRTGGGWARVQVCSLAALAAGSLLYKLVLLWGDGGRHALAVHFLPAYLDQFALGMGLAVLTVWLVRSDRPPRAVRLVDRFPAAPWLVALLAYLSLAHIGLPEAGGLGRTTESFMTRHVLFGVIGLGILLPAAIGNFEHGLTRRFLANRVLLYLGLVSYAIYLWHPTVILFAGRHGLLDGVAAGWFTWPVITLLASTLIATVSYYVVERPALRLKRRFGGVRSPSPRDALADGVAAEVPT